MSDLDPAARTGRRAAGVCSSGERTGASVRRAPRLHVTAALLALCAAAPAAWSPGDGRATSASTRQERASAQVPIEPRLQNGAVLLHSLVHDEPRSWVIHLRSHEFVQVDAECGEMDFALTAYSPSGAQVARTAYRHAGVRRVSFIAIAPGDYRLEVRDLETARTVGTLRLRVGALRRAGPRDAARVSASRLFAAAEALRDRATAASSRQAIEKYGAARVDWSRAGDVSGEAMALTRIADTNVTLSDLTRARTHYLLALARAKSIDDPVAQAAALNGLSRAALVIGDTAAARVNADLALTISRDAGQPALEAEALNNGGDVDAFVGRTSESLAVYDAALAAAELARDRSQRARALRNIGYSRADLRDGPAAEAAYVQALSLWEAAADQREIAITRNAFGHLYSAQGERQKALDAYQRARDVFDRLGDAMNLGIAFNGIGLVYLELGDRDTALGYFRRQLAAHRTAPYTQGEAGALARIGYCHYLLGRPAPALHYLRMSLEILAKIDDPSDEAFTNGLLGLAYEAVGRNADALHAHRRALDLARKIADRREESYALNRIARLLQKSGDASQALDLLALARGRSADVMDPAGESLSLFNIAVVERELNRLDASLTHVQQSLAISESLRYEVVSLDLRSSFFAELRGRHEFLVGLLMRLHAERPAQGFEVQAFEAVERARARSLLDGLAEAHLGVREGIDRALLDRKRTVSLSLNAAAQRIDDLRASNAPRQAIERAAGELDALSLQRRELDAQVRAQSPRYASLTQPPPVTLAVVQETIVTRDSVLLEYFLGADHSYLWAVTSDRVNAYELPPRARIEALARQLRTKLADPSAGQSGAQRPSASLAADIERASAILLAPAAADMNRPRILIVADGILHFIPFAALADRSIVKDRSAAAPIVMQHEVVHLPSASTLVLMRRDWKREREPSRSVIVFADPVFELDDPRIEARDAARVVHSREPRDRTPSAGLLRQALRDLGRPGTGVPRLLGSKFEAQAIASVAPGVTLATGFAATRTAAMSRALGDYRIVHFATHGLADSDRPELSGIVLSLVNDKGQSQDGFLRLHDIYDLDLPVDLVVLSACSGAVGKEVQGEGLVGLVRGFMYAGSRRVLASLWKVDDEATGALMTRFYRGLFVDGLAPAAALRRAQVDVMKIRRWRHPFYWAGFVLQGDPLQ